ncbi:MAG: galactokinase [Clostridia bacterium]|nr:galactokinase [Clostridia bacterium]
MDKQQLIKEFINVFGGSEEDVRIFASPGRVNLIGEHTDYNGGFVFPAALTIGAFVAVRKREDKILRMKATDLEGIVEANLETPDEYKDLFWGNYQVGVAVELMKDGIEVSGFDMLYDDNLPHGGGLSSSAAIEVSTALVFTTYYNESKGIKDPVDMIYMAKIGQRAERNYCGVNCGIMDQFASAMGKEDHVIFLDCKDLSYKLVPLKIDGYKIVIANTNKKRGLADSKYNERRSECEDALAKLQTVTDYEYLGVIPTDVFEANKNVIGDEIKIKRATHVVYECDRVLKSIEALNNNDVLEFGRLMNASHDSLRDLYEVTGIELDTLVDESRKIEGCIGSRMTGAGFGGCTVSIVREDMVDTFKAEVEKNYTAKIGYAPSFYVSDLGDGGREIK